MKTKLTLTVEDSIVRRTKRLAQQRKTSVSALFEEWSATSTREMNQTPLGEALTGRWAGAREDGDARLTYLLEKHGD
jgi:DNA gyrase inhibitor GyrI